MVLKQQLKQNKQRAKIMRKIFAGEFMTIDGVIQNEEADGDGFKYGGWFFPYADQVTGAVDLLLGRKTFAGWETYWPTHSNFWPKWPVLRLFRGR